MNYIRRILIVVLLAFVLWIISSLIISEIIMLTGACANE